MKEALTTAGSHASHIVALPRKAKNGSSSAQEFTWARLDCGRCVSCSCQAGRFCTVGDGSMSWLHALELANGPRVYLRRLSPVRTRPWISGPAPFARSTAQRPAGAWLRRALRQELSAWSARSLAKTRMKTLTKDALYAQIPCKSTSKNR